MHQNSGIRESLIKKREQIVCQFKGEIKHYQTI